MWSLVLLPLLGAAAAPLPEKLATGMELPGFQGVFLTGKKVSMPVYSKGKLAFLSLGFTYDSRFSVEAYTNRFREDFGKEPRCTFFEVPMMDGAARMGKWFIDGGMRRGTPKELHENVITVYGGVDPWKKMMGYQGGNEAFLILLDETGKVQWMHHGGFKEDHYLEVKEIVTKLLQSVQ